MLQQVFLQLSSATTNDRALQEQYWQEIVSHYNSPDRHYHNLSHLESLIAELEPCRLLLQDYSTILYSVFYHDIVYQASRSDNEEQSAQLAVQRMQALHTGTMAAEQCRSQILATKTHQRNQEQDTNLFTDADLSVLGKEPEWYKNYSRQIRQEYAIYPDELYFPGRAKVLQHFLEMPFIYKTTHFRNLYENQARHNIREELNGLS